MSDNRFATPFARSLNTVSSQRAADAQQQLGKALPCKVISIKGQIVTVAFQVTGFTLPNTEMPIATSKYDWIPVVAGDLGVAEPADVYLGGISGLGGGTADYGQRGNLSTLIFVPVANSSWVIAAGATGNMRVVQGPDGVLIQDDGGKATVKVTPTGITMAFGTNSIVINSSGVTITGPLVTAVPPT